MVMESMDFEQLLAGQKSKLVRALNNRGLTLTPNRMDLVQTIFENTARMLWTEILISPPKKSPSLASIRVKDDGKVVGWHPINGVWTQITQVPLPDGTVAYYTNGKKETPIVERPNK